jgi:DNA gyrase inhibitor GyrI
MYMQTEEMNLTTLSEMVGYDNPQSFSKAFKKQFGISPKIYIKLLRNKLESYIQSSGNRQYDLSCEFCEIDHIELVYVRIWGEYGAKEPYETAWNKLIRFLKANDVLSESTRYIGISFDDPNITKHDQYRFYACASVEKKIIPTGEFGTIQIKKGRYAVFTLKGDYSGLQKLYNNISVNFKYTLRHGIAFEEYLNNPHNVNENELLTKIYIPLK